MLQSRAILPRLRFVFLSRRSNLVDTTYRNDLRELNEPNFAGFDAKVEQRLAAALPAGVSHA